MILDGEEAFFFVIMNYGKPKLNEAVGSTKRIKERNNWQGKTALQEPPTFLVFESTS